MKWRSDRWNGVMSSKIDCSMKHIRLHSRKHIHFKVEMMIKSFVSYWFFVWVSSKKASKVFISIERDVIKFYHLCFWQYISISIYSSLVSFYSFLWIHRKFIEHLLIYCFICQFEWIIVDSFNKHFHHLFPPLLLLIPAIYL